MRTFVRKSLRILLTLWGVATVLFVLFRLLGDPAEALSAQRTDIATQQAIHAELGLDQPLIVQYAQYL
ncbi:MAG: ABC transporter permease, partial [Bacteroidota bacterium]